MILNYNSAIIFASKYGTKTPDGQRDDTSVFTKILINKMERVGVTLKQAFYQTKKDVEKKIGKVPSFLCNEICDFKICPYTGWVFYSQLAKDTNLIPESVFKAGGPTPDFTSLKPSENDIIIATMNKKVYKTLPNIKKGKLGDLHTIMKKGDFGMVLKIVEITDRGGNTEYWLRIKGFPK